MSAVVNLGISQERSRLRNFCSTMCRQRLVITMVAATTPVVSNIDRSLPARAVRLNAILMNDMEEIYDKEALKEGLEEIEEK